jgi:hypothetical protein
MLAFFLDESGIFEVKEEPVLLNAGLVYKGQGLEQDIKNLKNFLKKLCKQFGLVFPEGLHGSEIRNRNLKQQIQTLLLEHLGQQNCWSIIGIINGDFEQDTRSNIVDERSASNLYHNMLIRLLDNALYYSPLSDNEKYAQLHIASRVVMVHAKDKMRRQQYEELGYNYKDNKDGRFRYFLIDERVVKAALGQLYMERAKSPHLDFQLFVKSIYRDGNVGLMAADLICNYLYGNIKRKSDDKGLEKLIAGFQNYNLNSFLWVYGKLDDKYRILHNMQSEGNIYEFLNLSNQIFTKDYGIARYYASRWMPQPPYITPFVLEEAIRVLNEKRKDADRNYPQELQVVKKIRQLAEQDLGEIPPKNAYQLYDMMLQLNNHMGNPAEAITFGEKAIQLLKQQPRTRDNSQRRLETLLRMSGIETNRFNFQGAVYLLNEELAPYLESRLNSGDENEFGPLIDPTLGKCYSALGQNYAFLGSYEPALDAFKRALDHFATEPGNIEITTTHILQLALAMGDMVLFEEYAPSYFGDPTIGALQDNEKVDAVVPDFTSPGGAKDSLPGWLLQHRWQNAMQSNNPFKLLVFLKAVNLAGLWGKMGLLERIQNADYKNYFASNNSHPWEFIFRHLAESAFKSGDFQRGKSFIKKSIVVDAPRPSLTFKVLHLGTLAIADSYLYKGKELERYYNVRMAELKQICLSSPEDTKHIYSQDNPDSWFYGCITSVDSDHLPHKKVQMFIDRFTYAYR